MQSTGSPWIRKTGSSCVALFTTGAMLSATFFGCSSQRTAKPEGEFGARSEIITNYITSTGDQAYQVDAPDNTARMVGIAKYDVKIAEHVIDVGGLDASGERVATVQISPSADGLQMVTREAGIKHTYLMRATGSVETKDFMLHVRYDGHDFTAGFNARGQIGSTGDLAYAPPPSSPRIKQMMLDIIPTNSNDAVLSKDAINRCLACFLCGAGLALLTAALAALNYLGWVILAEIIALIFAQSPAAAIAALIALGVTLALAQALVDAIVALGWQVVKWCFKCLTGIDLFTDTCTADGAATGSNVGIDPGGGSGTGTGSGSDPGGGTGTGTGSGSDACSCPVDTDITPDLAKALIPAFQ